MVKLTVDLIASAPQHINAVLDRELTLRGWKIPTIENLGACNNQFDTIDMTDNDLRKLDNFPELKRLKNLYLSNNRISYIGPDLVKYIPRLNTLVLTNNNLSELADLLPLAAFESLQHLSLMGNPVTKRRYYRAFVIATLSAVRVIDFKRIRLVEREEAEKLFKGKKGAALKEQLMTKSGQTGTTTGEGALTNGHAADGEETASTGPVVRDSQEVDRIKEAIVKASTLHEVEHLKQLLESGQPLPQDTTPGAHNGTQAQADDAQMEVEEDEPETAPAEDNPPAVVESEPPTDAVPESEVPPPVVEPEEEKEEAPQEEQMETESIEEQPLVEKQKTPEPEPEPVEEEEVSTPVRMTRQRAAKNKK